MNIVIRAAVQEDFENIAHDFNEQGFARSQDVFDVYLFEQTEDRRMMWIAYDNDTQKYVGYVTVVYQSEYEPFRASAIPEIKDLNVVPAYRRQGIASQLLEVVEQEAFLTYETIGIGVYLLYHSGTAQRLYVKRGFIPDGNGCTNYYQSVEPGKMVSVDGLTLWLIKKRQY